MLPGDIDHLIADDHAVLERQFQLLEAGRGDRRVLVDQIRFELALHADAEERVLYPAMAAAGEPHGTAHARDEHQAIKELLVVLDADEPGEPEFEDALARLIAEVRLHVADEEDTLLPLFRALAGPERMAELGREFLVAKRSAPTYPHPNAPDSRLGHLITDPVAALTDRLRDRLTGRHVHLATDPSGLLDPQAQRLLDALSALVAQPCEILEPEPARRQPTQADAVRRILAEDERSTAPEPVGDIRTITIAGPGGELPLRIYHPTGSRTAPLPVLLWIHGGGWVLHTADTYDASCRGLVNKTGAIVVSPEYRRAPEAVFPAAHDDVLTTFRWLRGQAAELGGDPARLAVGGESVGATMAAATSWQLLRAGEEPPVAQVLVYPLTTVEQFGASMTDAADARPLNRPLLSWLTMHAFAGVPHAVRDPRVDLLGIPAGELAGMPPTLVITAERDVLRSQGEEFARHLEAAGVPTTLSRYHGVMHEFFGASAVLDKAELAQLEAAGHLRRAFGTRVAV